jgi:hypothetical protein
MVETPKSLINLGHEVVTWMDGQRDFQYPFCDTYLMWHHFLGKNTPEDYNCTFPYWRKHGNTVLEDISITGKFKEQIEKLVIIKGTNKGITLPNLGKARRQAWYVIHAVDGHINAVVGKDEITILTALEVLEYKLHNWKNKNLNWNQVKEGEAICTGNLWNSNVHLKEGDIVAHVLYHND